MSERINHMMDKKSEQSPCAKEDLEDHHIVYCFDNGYLLGAFSSIASVLHFADSPERFHFHAIVLNSTFCDQTEHWLRTLVLEFRAKLSIYTVPKAFFDSYGLTSIQFPPGRHVTHTHLLHLILHWSEVKLTFV